MEKLRQGDAFYVNFFEMAEVVTSQLTIMVDGEPMEWNRLLAEIERDASAFKEIRIIEIIPNDSTVRFVRQ